MTKTTFESFDKKQIPLAVWGDMPSPKALVLIVHSRGEKAETYSPLGERLSEAGCICYAPSLRGSHEPSPPDESQREIWLETVKDLASINRYYSEKYPKTPVFAFGSGWGVFLVLSLIQRFRGVSGAILSGVPDYSRFSLYRAVAFAFCLFGGRKRKSALLNRFIGNKKPAYKSINGGTSVDMSSSEGVIDAPFDYTGEFVSGYLGGAARSVRRSCFSTVSEKLPVFIIAGKDDPCGKKSLAPKRLRNLMEELGFAGVEMKLFSGGEDFLFSGGDDCISAIADFLNAHI